MSDFEWLELETRLDSGWSFKTLTTDGYQRVNNMQMEPIAVLSFSDEGYPVLLVPMADDDEDAPSFRSAVLESKRVHLELSGMEASTFTKVTCRDVELSDVFRELVYQLIRTCREGGKNPHQEFTAIVEDWRRLLEKEAINTLGNKRRGLIGELEILRLLAERSPESAISTWQGPLGALHDFVSSSFDIEVKSTMSTKSKILRVDGMTQLRPLPGAELLLAHVRVVKHPAGKTIADHVDDLVDMGIDRNVLMDRIHNVLTAEQLLLVDREPVSVHSVDLYRVDDSFPWVDVIDPRTGQYPKGILDVALTIDLTVANAIDGADSAQIFDAMVGKSGEPV